MSLFLCGNPCVTHFLTKSSNETYIFIGQLVGSHEHGIDYLVFIAMLPLVRKNQPWGTSHFMIVEV